MQTFLPFEDFRKSAASLDRQRLGKQRVETLQIMKVLTLEVGWINHPATKMWAGYEGALLEYQDAVCMEWVSRGYKDTCYVKTEDLYFEEGSPNWGDRPHWLGNQRFHLSHQSNLVRKDAEFYVPQFPNIKGILEYVWPKGRYEEDQAG